MYRFPAYLIVFLSLKLVGFGQFSEDSTGDLVCGFGKLRTLPVRDYKVTVEIKDQIAQTTVEKSFVNDKNWREKGLFYFPLPCGASISDFGMWINGKYIEAIIVEKHRVRETLENHSFRGHDKALLELNDGNIFKAQVSSIQPHSEAKIKFSYTQVLPMDGSEYRYTYPLKSEKLNQEPIRGFRINVAVHSQNSLRAVKCTTHDAQIEFNNHSASVEFLGEYCPFQKDFELTVERREESPAVTFIPSVRGEDSYFMALINLPDSFEDVGIQFDVKIDGFDSYLIYHNKFPGSQHILTGRFGGSACFDKAKIIITGKDPGKPFTYTASTPNIRNLETNEFIPRLWASDRIDYLMKQEPSVETQLEIVALSSEFQILTSLTTFLVLESDIDRQRYSVERRFKIRDGIVNFGESHPLWVDGVIERYWRGLGNWRKRFHQQCYDQLSRFSNLGYHKMKDKDPWDPHQIFQNARPRGKPYLQLAQPGELLTSKKEEDVPVLLFPYKGASLNSYRFDGDYHVLDGRPPDPLNPMHKGVFSPYRGGMARDSSKPILESKPDDKYSKLVGIFNPFLHHSTVANLFPGPEPRQKLPPVTHNWTEEAQQIASSLLRRDDLDDQPLNITIVQTEYIGQTGIPSFTKVVNGFISASRWIRHYSGSWGGEAHWCDTDMSGSWYHKFNIAERHKTVCADQLFDHLTNLPTTGIYRSLTDVFADKYHEMEQVEPDRVWLTVGRLMSKERFLIDTNRNVILRSENHKRDFIYKDFIELNGKWYPTLIQSYWKKREVLTTVYKIDYQPIGIKQMESQFNELYKSLDNLLVLDSRTGSPKEMQESLAKGEDSVAARMILLHDCAAKGQWELADQHWDALAKFVPSRETLKWLKLRYLNMKGRSGPLFDHAMSLTNQLDQEESLNPTLIYRLIVFILQEVRGPGNFLKSQEKAIWNSIEPILNKTPSVDYGSIQMGSWLEIAFARRSFRRTKTEASKALADQYPKEYGVSYGQHLLYNLEDPENAFEYSKSLLSKGLSERWHSSYLSEVFGFQVNCLDALGMTEDALELLKDRQDFFDSEYYSLQYLQRLAKSGRSEEALILCRRWLDGDDTVKQNAAFQYLEELESFPKDFNQDVFQYLSEHILAKHYSWGMSSFFTNQQFSKSESATKLHQLIHQQLIEVFPSEAFVSLRSFLDLAKLNKELTSQDWLEIAHNVERRWAIETTPHLRYWIGQDCLQILEDLPESSHYISFLHRLYETNKGKEKYEYATKLVNDYCKGTWTLEREELLWKFLDQMGTETAHSDQIPQTFLKWLINEKLKAHLNIVKEGKHGVEISPKERQELVISVMTGIRDRLKNKARRNSGIFSGTYHYYAIEIDLFELGTSQKEITKQCWEYIENNPITPGEDEEVVIFAYNDHLSMLEKLALEKGSDPLLSSDIITYYSQKIKKCQPVYPAWKDRLVRFLFAKGDYDEIKVRLSSWILDGDVCVRWLKILAWLEAESANPALAAATYERIQNSQGLTAGELRQLALWYIASGQTGQWMNTVQQSYSLEEPGKLEQILWIKSSSIPNQSDNSFRRIPRDPVTHNTARKKKKPVVMDPSVPTILRHLFQESRDPSSHLESLAKFYDYTQDPILLSIIPESIVDLEDNNLSDFLTNIHKVLTLLQNEDAVDALLKAAQEALIKATTDRQKRALHLISVAAHSKGIEVSNNPKKHSEASILALDKAFQCEMSEEELKTMDAFLSKLSGTTHQKLNQAIANQIQRLQTKLDSE